MLVIVVVLIAILALVLVARARVPGGVNAASLGWVSERWLAEYRSSHPT